jgi:tetratricopeptide (TPR) repeat protein
MAETVAFKYRAFISYSHADTTWAKWLHRGLEGFRIDKDLVGRETSTGTIPKSLRPIFRDRDDFTAGHSLTEQTLAALDASRALIVICSPASAKSRYVTEEIRLFKVQHPERPVIPLIVGGRPGDPKLECFPRSLKFKLTAKGQIGKRTAELLAADAREDGDGKRLALAKTVAGLLGVSADEIYRRAEREARRKGRVRNGVLAVLAFLAIAATSSAVYAWQQLQTNEAFLTATLTRATDLVNTAVTQADKYGMPRNATLSLLTQAEGLFDDMARLGRPTPELRHQKAWMLIQFARNYAILGNTEKWEERTRKAYALLAELAAEAPTRPEYQKGLLATQQELGDVLAARGNLPEALRLYLESRTTARKIATADSNNPGALLALAVAHERVGDALLAQGDVAGALQSLQDCLVMRRLLLAGNPADPDTLTGVSIVNDKIGDVLRAQGKLDEALVYYRASIDINEPRAKSDESNVAWQRDLSTDYINLGDVLLARGDLQEAQDAFSKSLAVRQHLHDIDTSNTTWQRDLSVAYNKVGDVLAAQGDTAGALEAYDAGLAVIQRIAKADSANTGRQRDLAISQLRIGNILAAQGDLAGALQSYRRSLVIIERLAALDLHNAEWQRDLAVNNWKVATILAQQGAYAEALAMFHRGRDIVTGLGQEFPGNPQFSKDVAEFDAEIAKLGQPTPARP